MAQKDTEDDIKKPKNDRERNRPADDAEGDLPADDLDLEMDDTDENAELADDSDTTPESLGGSDSSGENTNAAAKSKDKNSSKSSIFNSSSDAKSDKKAVDRTEDTEASGPATAVVGMGKTGPVHRFKQWYGRHKKIAISLTIIVVLAILLGVPYTRYLLVGSVWRQNFTVKVMDTETGKPVSSAKVQINGKNATTNGQGEATLKLNSGPARLHIEKKYYQSADSSVLVPIFKQKQADQIKLKATGRQVTVTVTNKITQKVLSEATVSALDTKAKTDKNGQAVLVIPADKQMVSASVEATGYNKTSVNIKVTADEKANRVTITPAGQVYFLSNASGKIDVVKTNLDGSNRSVVLPGTGKENQNTTVLLASRDWKYLALLSHRDTTSTDKIYLIDTTNNDALTTMDEGDAAFGLVGWSDHRFVYNVNRLNKSLWEPNISAIKSFDAESKKLATLTQEGGEGSQSSYVSSYVSDAFLLKNEVVYLRKWIPSYPTPVAFTGKKLELRSVKPDGSNNHVVASYDNVTGQSITQVNARLYEPQGVWIKNSTADKTEEYEDGSVKQIANVSADQFFTDNYPTYLLSPNGTMSFWQNVVDGKNKLSVGDSDGKNAKEVAKASPYSVYGWYTDDYLLVTKDASELYIMPIAGGEPLKLTNYYKPQTRFNGYGGGYGGL